MAFYGIQGFLGDVTLRLRARGLIVFPACRIAGLTVDLVVQDGEKALGVDLIGYPGAFSDAFEIERYKLFGRAGLTLMPLPYSAWSQDPQACVVAVIEELGNT